jgi:hypothetical protein
LAVELFGGGKFFVFLMGMFSMGVVAECKKRF